jgi:hypothetical protein
VASLTNAPVMSMASASRSVASGAAAAALALALSSGNFDMAPPRALAAPPAMVCTSPAGGQGGRRLPFTWASGAALR